MLIDTTKGPLEEVQLEKREGFVETFLERTTWVEYWLAGELVHRSAHVHLKQGLASALRQGAFA